MNAAETRASSAMADWTPLTVVSTSRTTAAIDTFMSDVSTTSTNIAIDSKMASLEVPVAASGAVALGASLRVPPSPPASSIAELPTLHPAAARPEFYAGRPGAVWFAKR
jgi:hypothetical protein